MTTASELYVECMSLNISYNPSMPKSPTDSVLCSEKNCLCCQPNHNMNLPSLLFLSTNIMLSTLLIVAVCRTCHMNFIIDLAHHGVSLAQW